MPPKVNEQVTFMSHSATVMGVRSYAEDGYTWHMVDLRLETGRIIAVNMLDLEEVQAGVAA